MNSEDNILIFDLFSGVGFCNQLFSLETAVYLANISNRHLVLCVRFPLSHCGRVDWEYGFFPNFFPQLDATVSQGITVIKGKTGHDFVAEENVSNVVEVANENWFSRVLFQDETYLGEAPPAVQGGRPLSSLVLSDFEDHYAIKISHSNASRLFTNFLTNLSRYEEMNRVARALSLLPTELTELVKSIELPKQFAAVHFRFGDTKRPKEDIDKTFEEYKRHFDLEALSRMGLPLLVMADRKDGEFLRELDKHQLDYQFTGDLTRTVSESYQPTFTKCSDKSVIDFLLEKIICEKASMFYANYGSTVSAHINYQRFLSGVGAINQFCNRIDPPSEDGKLSFADHAEQGPGIGWRAFWTDNVLT